MEYGAGALWDLGNSSVDVHFPAAITNMRVGVRTEAPTTSTPLHPYAYDVCATIETTSSTDTMMHFECSGYPRGQYVVVQKAGGGHSLMICEIIVGIQGELDVHVCSPQFWFTVVMG